MDTDYLVINSEDRDTTLYPYSNTYTMYLPNPIRYVTRVELVQASIPNVIENVTDGTDFIQVSNLVNTTLHSFSIANGFYSGQGLMTTVQNAINFESNIVVSFLDDEGKYLFYRPTGDGDFKLKPSTLMAKLMGFSDTSERTSTSIADESETSPTFSLYANNTRYRGTTFLKSDRIINLSTDDQIFLDINELNSVWMEQMNKLNDTTASQNNFGPIPMDVDSGEVKEFSSTKDYAYGTSFSPPISQISRLTVKWRKLNGELIQFENSRDNSFMLRVYSKFRKGELVA
jgi:hypothetical protein